MPIPAFVIGAAIVAAWHFSASKETAETPAVVDPPAEPSERRRRRRKARHSVTRETVKPIIETPAVVETPVVEAEPAQTAQPEPAPVEPVAEISEPTGNQEL